MTIASSPKTERALPTGERLENLVTTPWADYELLDSGDGRRLERFGRWVFDRPASQAIWPPSRTEESWRAAQARFERRPDGGGDWTFSGAEPALQLVWERVRMSLRPTGFGHVGLFPEQASNWRWIRDSVAGRPEPPSVLNLFAYTGASSLAAASGGAKVTHLDAVKGMVKWASDNAAQSGLGDSHIRWIVDDVTKFVRRELRRGRRYDAIVLDPPTFGRGRQGQVWKLEPQLWELMEQCRSLLTERPLLLLLSAHTPGVTPQVLRNLAQPLVQSLGGQLQYGEMLLTDSERRSWLPSGAYVRWSGEGR